MTPQQYHLAFPRTLSNPLSIDLVHAGVGLGTETFELEQAFKNNDRPNILEELSDDHWYDDLLVDVVMRTSAGAMGLDFHLQYPDYKFVSFHDALYDLRAAVADVQDVGKRVFWYGLHIEDAKKDLVPRLVRANQTVRGVINALCIELKVDIAEIRARNISKLYIRQPGKFDGLEFVTRDLPAERELFIGL